MSSRNAQAFDRQGFTGVHPVVLDIYVPRVAVHNMRFFVGRPNRTFGSGFVYTCTHHFKATMQLEVKLEQSCNEMAFIASFVTRLRRSITLSTTPAQQLRLIDTTRKALMESRSDTVMVSD